MIQRMLATIDTKKTNYKNVGKINHGDDLILELAVLSDGDMISFDDPMVDLLVKKSDGKMIRQNYGIEHIKPNKFIIEVSKDCVTSPGLTTNQLIINDNGRISTCMFYYTILNSLEEDIIQSISNVEVLEQLDEFVIQIKDKMEIFDDELLNKISNFEDAIEDLEKSFGDTSAELLEAELSRNEAEQSRAQAESVRVQNESRRLQNDLDLANAEAERVRAENVRIQNEANRALVDAVMDQKESEREDSELERIQNESKRATDELVRQQNENTRQSNEYIRMTNETDRKTQENRRVTAETNRVNAETTRRNNENSRISNEIERQKTMNEMKSVIDNVNGFHERVGVIEDEIDDINSSLNNMENEIEDLKQNGSSNSLIKEFRTFQELKISSNLSVGDVCKTYGYSTVNDKGGNTYIVKALSEPNGYFKYDIGNNLMLEVFDNSKRLNVISFGVTPLKSDDETKVKNTKILADLIELTNNKGYNLYFPALTYYFNQIDISEKSGDYIISLEGEQIAGNNSYFNNTSSLNIFRNSTIVTNGCGFINRVNTTNTNNGTKFVARHLKIMNLDGADSNNYEGTCFGVNINYGYEYNFDFYNAYIQGYEYGFYSPGYTCGGSRGNFLTFAYCKYGMYITSASHNFSLKDIDILYCARGIRLGVGGNPCNIKNVHVAVGYSGNDASTLNKLYAIHSKGNCEVDSVYYEQYNGSLDISKYTLFDYEGYGGGSGTRFIIKNTPIGNMGAGNKGYFFTGNTFVGNGYELTDDPIVLGGWDSGYFNYGCVDFQNCISKGYIRTVDDIKKCFVIYNKKNEMELDRAFGYTFDGKTLIGNGICFSETPLYRFNSNFGKDSTWYFIGNWRADYNILTYELNDIKRLIFSGIKAPSNIPGYALGAKFKGKITIDNISAKAFNKTTDVDITLGLVGKNSNNEYVMLRPLIDLNSSLANKYLVVNVDETISLLECDAPFFGYKYNGASSNTQEILLCYEDTLKITYDITMEIDSRDMIKYDEVITSVTGITLSDENITLNLNGTKQLTYVISPTDATNKNVIWSSSNDNCKVSNGLVTAVKEGTSVITVTTVDGNYSDTCNVNVVNNIVALDSISLDKSTSSLFVGNSEQLTVVYNPTDATNKNIIWSANNSNCTVVNGLVTAVSEGVCIITATSEDGNKVATCTYTIAAAQIVTDGLEGWWQGNDITSMTLNDKSGKDRDITMSGCTLDGSKLVFTNGGSGSVEIPSTSILTLEFVVKYPASGSVTSRCCPITTLEHSGSSGFAYRITKVSDGSCVQDLEYGTSGSGRKNATSTELSNCPDFWYPATVNKGLSHIVIRYNETNSRFELIVDGEEFYQVFNEDSGYKFNPLVTKIGIGLWSTSIAENDIKNMELYCARAYSKMLTDEEIAQNYLATYKG